MAETTSSNSGVKRPAELEVGPEAEAGHGNEPSTGIITLRISSIPTTITKECLSQILESLKSQDTKTEGKRRRESNIHSFSLAPSASAPDSHRYQVATATFKEIPPSLVCCVSNTDTIHRWMEAAGERFEVGVDSHFRGLTPLNNPSNPSVEYVMPFSIQYSLSFSVHRILILPEQLI